MADQASPFAAEELAYQIWKELHAQHRVVRTLQQDLEIYRQCVEAVRGKPFNLNEHR